ncbi:IclR family transcriptional regulator [Sphingomonas canadensis]|uniref:IclR family transcriptional regulator n=1 Tax=Sphingomonas canadensis TaxID=1219257 RepID=A0ABW3H9X5_9SPHN|nr:IclR family transcriptional regulator C-terminal domain-containing protein [Sphingomonas canadensis]MCW3837551.1 helix-turn-helix domain-containing protein [Sphingomonas canadensis]
MGSSETPATVKSAMRTLDILEFLVGQGRPLAAHELSSALAIPVSSLSYLLSTLVERGYLERAGRQYAPGAALARLNPNREGPTLAERVAPLVRAVSTQLNETASFFVQRGDELEALATETGNQSLRYALDIGQHAPMHAFAAGKALLARLPAEALDAYFAGSKRRAYTANTITDEAAIRAELDQIRQTGIAFTREEHTAGIIGIGRAAMADGGLAGAFSVAIPVARCDAGAERAAIDALKRATALLGSGED